jgi:biotin carboxyl carrier protein
MKEYKYKINGNDYTVVIANVEDNIAQVEVNGTSYTVEMNKQIKKAAPLIKPAVSAVAPGNPAASTPAPSVPVVKPAGTPMPGSPVKSPLPGVILDIYCKVGDKVKIGDRLFNLEAMKMENIINCDRDGEIKEVLVSKGAAVLEGANLVIVG